MGRVISLPSLQKVMASRKRVCVVVRFLFSVALFFDFSLLKREKEIRRYKTENVLTENGNQKLEKKNH